MRNAFAIDVDDLYAFRVLHGALPGTESALDEARQILTRMISGVRPDHWTGYWIGRCHELGGVCVRALPGHSDLGMVWKSDFPKEFPVGSWVRPRCGSLEDAMRASRTPVKVLVRISPQVRSKAQAVDFLRGVSGSETTRKLQRAA